MTRRRLLLLALVLLSAVTLQAATDTRVPTGDINSTWTPSTGTDRFAMVDDAVGAPDDDITYISATTDVEQKLSHTAFSLPGGSTVSKVSVTARCRILSGDSQLYLQLRVNGGDFGGAVTTPGSSYSDVTKDWTTNPWDTNPWTQADVEGTGSLPLQGMELRSTLITTGSIRCTQVYLTVTYTTAAGRSVIICGGGGCVF